MMPEQVWDDADLPARGLVTGQPAGSAVPLVWAHAEYLKLLRSAVDGKVFDRVDAVYKRYCEPEGRKGLRSDIEIYSLRRPIQKLAAGDTLRILDEERFEVVWSADGWQTMETTPSRSLGSAGHSADISTDRENANGRLSWTFHWPDEDRWLGYNVDIAVEAE